MSITMLGYVRVSTAEQAESGAGLAAQRAAVEAAATREGWHIEWVEDAGYSGKDLAHRPGIQAALEALGKPHRTRKVAGLVVSKLDRLTRSLVDFAGIMAAAHRQGWRLIALDLNVDTGTPAGGLLANVMCSVNEFERKIIGQRTKDALAQVRLSGTILGNPRFREARTSAVVRDRIVELRSQRWSYGKIAGLLNEEKVATSQGGSCWHASAVRSVERRLA